MEPQVFRFLARELEHEIVGETIQIPADGAIQVAGSTAIVATFSEPLGAATDLTSLITVTGPSGTIAGTTTSEGRPAYLARRGILRI